MASTTSPNKNYELQGTGDNDGTWGTHLNADFSQVDLNLGGRLNLSVAGSSDVTLTTDQSANIYHNYTGVLTGNISVKFPASNGGLYIIKNATTGAFTLTVKPDGGTGISVPQGTTVQVFIDPDQTAAVVSAQPLIVSGGGLEYSSSFLRRSALTGDVTAPAGSNATTLGIVTTRGDLIYRNATVPARLAIGGANTVLKSDGTDPSWDTVSAILDSISSTQGVILYRGASAWSALATGTSGQFLKTQGAAANPAWADLPASSGSITTIGSGSFSGATQTFSSIPATYAYLVLQITGASCATNTRHIQVQIGHSSADATASNYISGDTTFTEASLFNSDFADQVSSTTYDTTIYFYGYQGGPYCRFECNGKSSTLEQSLQVGLYIGAVTAIDTIKILFNGSGNFDAGTYGLYGIT